MRVARVIERLPPAFGGKEVHGAQLSRALAARGVAQHVFCRSGDRLGEGIEQTWLRPGLASRAHRLGGFCAAAARAVAAAHRRAPFDLVHVHGDFLEAACGAVLSRRLGVPALLTVHGGLSDDEAHHLLRVGAYSAMQRVLVVSAPLAGELAELGVSAPLSVMASGVREAFFADAPAERDEAVDAAPAERDGGRIVVVGRLAPVKGIEQLLAARDLLADRRELSWTVVAGGEGPDADRLRAEIAARPDMECLVERDPERLAALVRGAGAFVLPSVPLPGQREGVPTALLEAVACGTPVVATDTGGVAAVLADGRGGVLVPPGDAAALAAGIERVLDDPAAAAERARTAREAGWARRWTDVAADVQAAYGEAAERFGRDTVVFALPWFDMGGAERFVLTLAEGLGANGVVPCVAASPGQLTAELRAPAEFAPLHRLRSGRDALHNLVALTGLAVRTRPRAVNSHHVPTGVLARAAGALAAPGARQALTIHVTEDPRMAPVAGLIGAAAFDRVLPVAESVRREVTRLVPPPLRDRFAVVHAGVETPAPAPERARAVVAVGRLVERKGHRVLLDAWRRVQADDRAAGWSLELWGDGPEEAALREQTERLEIAETVNFRGSVRGAAGRLAAFPVVALPSFREGLPLVLLEAMAAGCTVVCTDLPGCRELLGDGVGLRVPTNDASALAGALLAAMADEGLRARGSEAGRRHVAEHFSRERMLERYAAELGIRDRAAGPG